MKTKSLFSASAVLVSMLFCGLFSVDTATCNSAEGVRIIIRQKPTEPQGAPKSISYNPFSAELTDVGVLLVSDCNCGSADVTLWSVGGDYYYTVFDTSDGATLLPVSGNTGDYYTINITMSDGTEFEGDFNI